jgi:tRNA1(Val) A37 N6-methylase TrmN6
MTVAEPAGAPRHTVDAFHRGRFWLVQPAAGGHRAGMDAMTLAAAVPTDFTGLVADFGAGAGAAGLAVVSRCERARATLVERSPEMATFAEASLAHPANQHLSDRVTVLRADVTLTGKARGVAGLADNSFDFVIMNPPFNAGEDRATPDALRREAHVMADGLFEAWVRSAAAVVKPRGGIAIIARPESLAAILDALAGRFGNAEIVPVHPHADQAAIRIVVRGLLGARGKLALRPPLVLHDATTKGLLPLADAISNGTAPLFGD